MKITTSFIFLVSLFFSTQAQAYGTFLNTSKVLKGKDFNLSAYSQFFSSDRSGAYTALVLDLPFTSSTNLRFQAGAGSFDFGLGGSLKWAAVSQTADDMSFNLGAVFSAEYANDNSLDSFLFRLSPFISKNLTWEYGSFEPYLSTPVGLVTFNSESKVSSQFVIGTNIRFEDLSFMSFSLEGGFKIKNAESYFALMATVQLQK